jgi:hypothetical protein
MLRRSQVRNLQHHPLTHRDFYDILNNQSVKIRGGRYDRVLVAEPQTGKIVNDLNDLIKLDDKSAIGEIRTPYGNISMYTDPRIPRGTIMILERDDFDTWLEKMEEADDLAKFKIVNIGSGDHAKVS